MRKIIAILVIGVFMVNLVNICKAHSAVVDQQLIENLLDDYVSRSLRANEIQDYLNKQSYSYASVDGQSVLEKLLETAGKSFLSREKALLNLRSAVEKGYSSDTIVTSRCCDKTQDLVYDNRFLYKVNFEEDCVTSSPATGEDPIYLTKDFRNAARDNVALYPSFKWQYFGSVEGIFTIYPANAVENCFWFEPRIRPWYIEAIRSTHKDVVIVVDASGSMGDYYDGKRLIELGREAAQMLLNSLSSHDRVAVLAVSDEHWTLSNFSETENCFENKMALVTQRNVEDLIDFLNLIEPKGGTYYVNAIDEAFKYFESPDADAYYNSYAGDNIIFEKMIIFISDGSPNDLPEDIHENIRNHLSVVNDSVRIVTIGVGEQDFSILDSLCRINTKKEGDFVIVNGIKSIQRQLVRFFEKYDPVSPTANKPNWTRPYGDAFKLGDELISASLPVFIKGEFVGVVSMDIFLQDFINEINFVPPDQFSYFFISNKKEEVIYHPLLSHHYSSRLFVKAEAYERSAEIPQIMKMLRKSQNGSMLLNSSHYDVRGSSSFYGTAEVEIQLRYMWSPINDTRFTLVLVLNEALLAMPPMKYPPNGSLLYHRFDILPPKSSCWHAQAVATLDGASFYLPPQAYIDFEKHFKPDLSVSAVNALIKYLANKTIGNNTIAVKKSYIADLAIMNEAQVLWMTRDDENVDLNKDVIWRYFSTSTGIYRIYPGTRIPYNYNPLKRKWYIHIVANKHVPYVLSTPYYDGVTGALVMTIGRALFLPGIGNSTRTVVYAVLALDLMLLRFNSLFLEIYPFCRNMNLYKCYLIDTGGFLIAVSHWNRKKWFEIDFRGRQNFHKHITEVEPGISAFLVEKGIMKVLKCGDIGVGSKARSYKIEKITFSSDISVSFYDSYHFKLIDVKNTNTLILVRTEPTVRCYLRRYSCPCQQLICSSPDEDVHNCQCPCIALNRNYSHCINHYSNLKFSPPPCVPIAEDTTLADFSEYLLKSQPSNIPSCYPLRLDEEEIYEDKSLKVILWCLVGSSGVILVFTSYVYHRHYVEMKVAATNLLLEMQLPSTSHRKGVNSDDNLSLTKTLEKRRTTLEGVNLNVNNADKLNTYWKYHFPDLDDISKSLKLSTFVRNVSGNNTSLRPEDAKGADFKKEETSVLKKFSNLFRKKNLSNSTVGTIKEKAETKKNENLPFYRRVSSRRGSLVQRIHRNIEEFRDYIKNSDPSRCPSSTSSTSEKKQDLSVLEIGSKSQKRGNNNTMQLRVAETETSFSSVSDTSYKSFL